MLAGMSIEISTPALLFPAISLLFLSYTNRFLHLAALIRTLHSDWKESHDEDLRAQIENLRRRLVLIRQMQLLGALSLLVCVASMVSILLVGSVVGAVLFGVALLLMALSLLCLTREIQMSGGALEILLRAIERNHC